MTFDRERLVKLLGLLGSDHDGERAAAARMASDLVRASGLTWADLIVRSHGGGASAKSPEPAAPRRRYRPARSDTAEPPSPPRRREAFGWTARDLANRVAAMAHGTKHVDDFMRTLDPAIGLTDAEWSTLAYMARENGIDLNRPPRHRGFR